MNRKWLIINADDFGFSPDINAAIEELHRSGAVTNTTLMVDGQHVEEALRIAGRNPSLCVGLHLDLCPVAGLYRLPYAQMREELQNRTVLDQVAEEVARQISKFKSFGLEFQHMDGHRHFHALPELFDTVIGVAAGYGLKTIRFTKDWILPRTPSVYLDEDFFQQSLSLLRHRGIACTETFVYGWREYSPADVRPGWNELMVHVGYDDEQYLREYKRLASPAFLESLREAGIQLSCYAELARCIRGTTGTEK